jgi:hypothetical protein
MLAPRYLPLLYTIVRVKFCAHMAARERFGSSYKGLVLCGQDNKRLSLFSV